MITLIRTPSQLTGKRGADLGKSQNCARNEQAPTRLPIMSYTVAVIALIALAIGVIALNISYRRHRSHLTKRQIERENREEEIERACW